MLLSMRIIIDSIQNYDDGQRTSNQLGVHVQETNSNVI